MIEYIYNIYNITYNIVCIYINYNKTLYICVNGQCPICSVVL